MLPIVAMGALFEEQRASEVLWILSQGVPVQARVVRSQPALFGAHITYRYAFNGAAYQRKVRAANPPAVGASLQARLVPVKPGRSAVAWEQRAPLSLGLQALLCAGLLGCALLSLRGARRLHRDRYLLLHGEDTPFTLGEAHPMLLGPDHYWVHYNHEGHDFRRVLPLPRWDAPTGVPRSEDAILVIDPERPERATLKMRTLIDVAPDWRKTAQQLAQIIEEVRTQQQGRASTTVRAALTSQMIRLKNASAARAQALVADLDELLKSDRSAQQAFETWMNQVYQELTLEQVRALCVLRYGRGFTRQLTLRALARGSAIAALVVWLSLYLLFDAPSWWAAAIFGMSNLAGALVIFVSQEQPQIAQRGKR